MSSEKSPDKLDQVVTQAIRDQKTRQNAYRERALRMYPWICGRCAREFSRENLRELTVHHKDHNHDNNPHDGSNWELLCLYCHENEHSNYVDADYAASSASDGQKSSTTFRPFENLASILKVKK